MKRAKKAKAPPETLDQIDGAQALRLKEAIESSGLDEFDNDTLLRLLHPLAATACEGLYSATCKVGTASEGRRASERGASATQPPGRAAPPAPPQAKSGNPNCLCNLIPAPGSHRRVGLWSKDLACSKVLGPDPADIQRQARPAPPLAAARAHRPPAHPPTQLAGATQHTHTCARAGRPAGRVHARRAAQPGQYVLCQQRAAVPLLGSARPRGRVCGAASAGRPACHRAAQVGGRVGGWVGQHRRRGAARTSGATGGRGAGADLGIPVPPTPAPPSPPAARRQVFLELERGARDPVDPSGLLAALSLDHAVQQARQGVRARVAVLGASGCTRAAALLATAHTSASATAPCRMARSS